MNRLVLTPRFRRAYRKFVKSDHALQIKIDAALQQIEQDVFQPRLGTHKLSGNLAGLLACSCGYDCRIVFALEKDPAGREKGTVRLGNAAYFSGWESHLGNR